MRVTERLIRDTNQKNKRRKKEASDDGEETLTYMPKPRVRFINDSPDIFSGKMTEGINTQKSVFDRTAVFETRKGKYGD